MQTNTAYLFDVRFSTHEWQPYATIPVLPDNFSAELGEQLSLEVMKDSQTAILAIRFIHILGSPAQYKIYGGYIFEEGVRTECKMVIDSSAGTATIDTWVDTGNMGPDVYDTDPFGPN